MSDPNPTSPDAKPEAGKTPKSKTAKASVAVGSKTLPPLINPDWAKAIVKQHDIMGKTAELAVVALTTAIEKQVVKATKPEKLEKLVLAAIAESYRKARG